jgi:hypothetical protein
MDTDDQPLRSIDELDPDLDISRGKDKVWLVKLPKWLMEHWAKINDDNVELARVQNLGRLTLNCILMCIKRVRKLCAMKIFKFLTVTGYSVVINMNDA